MTRYLKGHTQRGNDSLIPTFIIKMNRNSSICRLVFDHIFFFFLFFPNVGDASSAVSGPSHTYICVQVVDGYTVTGRSSHRQAAEESVQVAQRCNCLNTQRHAVPRQGAAAAARSRDVESCT